MLHGRSLQFTLFKMTLVEISEEFDDALRNISRYASSDQTLRLSIPQEISKIGGGGGGIRQISCKIAYSEYYR